MFEEIDWESYYIHTCAILATNEPFTKLTAYQVKDVVKKHYDIVAKADTGKDIPTYEDLIQAMITTGELKISEDNTIAEEDNETCECDEPCIHDEVESYTKDDMVELLFEINHKLEQRVNELTQKVYALELNQLTPKPYYPYYPVYPNWEPMKIMYTTSGSNTTKGKEE